MNALKTQNLKLKTQNFLRKFAPMKGKLLFILLFLTFGIQLSAQENHVEEHLHTTPDSLKQPAITEATKALPDSIRTMAMTASTLLDADGNAVDTTLTKLPPTYGWRIDTRFGDRILAPMDTVRENFHRSSLVEGQGIAMQYLGNVGGAVQPIEFFQRKEVSQFPFMDVFDSWRRSPQTQLFLNTKIPYSNIKYQAGGGKEVAENHFNAEISSNFGKRLSVGFNFDYIYSRGMYKALFNKQTSYDLNASYIGDKYKMHLFVGNNNLQTSDNGGIRDDRYITNPESEDLQSFRGSSRDIPVMFEQGIRNHLRGRHFYLTNSYDIGKDEEHIKVNDTTSVWRKKKNYIAPASIILTTDYQDQRRKLFSPGTVTAANNIELTRLDSLYVPNIVDENGNPYENDGYHLPKYDEPMDDYMSHYTLRTTLAFRMNEGFQEWTKFGLTAFVEHELRAYLYPGSSPNLASRYVNQTEKENVWFVGGKLAKNQGQNFKFDVTAQKAINTNDLSIEGNIHVGFNLLGNDLSAKVNGYIKNSTPDFFQENFSSRNYVFRKNLNDTKRVYVGGEISLPKLSFSETTLSGGYENITDYIYIADTKFREANPRIKQDNYRRDIMQASKSINVIALKANQKLRAGILHFDMEALLQKSSDEDVLPLPTWTVYGNIYLQTKISKVLTVQLGADGYMHSEYNAPRYDILLGQFYNQRSEGAVKLGKFPHANAYINFHLKYTRLFIMAYNVAEGFGNGKSFTTPHYPTNPFMIKWGLSWRFNN